MRYREIVNELFDAPADFTYQHWGNTVVKGEFTVGKEPYTYMFLKHRGIWTLAFEDSNEDYELHGGRKDISLAVMTTMVKIMDRFIHDVQPEIMEFSAVSSEPSRVNLYKRMSARFKPSDYTATTRTEGEQVVFRFEKILKEERIDELFNAPFEYTMNKTRTDDGLDVIGEFDVNGKIYKYGFDSISGDLKSFYFAFHDQNGKFKITGDADEVSYRIMSTLVSITKRFISEIDPNRIVFSADVKEPSRISLYRKILQRFAKAGYSFKEENKYGDVVFTIKKDELKEERVDELMGVKRFKEYTYQDILDTLKSAFGSEHARLLGQGSNGAALEIAGKVYKMWMVDSAYQTFVEYAIKHQDNPFFPKFQGGIKKIPAFFIRHEKAPDYVNYIRMEKLTKMEGNLQNYKFDLKFEYDPDNDDEDYMDDAHRKSQLSAKDAIRLFEKFDGRISKPSIAGFLEELNWMRAHKYQMSDLSQSLIYFITTLIDLRSLGQKFDLHDGNFMKRGDQLVIIDPFFNQNDLKLNLEFFKFNQKLFRDDGEGKQAVQSRTAKGSN